MQTELLATRTPFADVSDKVGNAVGGAVILSFLAGVPYVWFTIGVLISSLYA